MEVRCGSVRVAEVARDSVLVEFMALGTFSEDVIEKPKRVDSPPCCFWLPRESKNNIVF